MRIPVTKRWRFPGAASFTLQPLLPRWLLSFRSLRRSSRFFSRSYIFFFVSIFSSRSSTSSVSNQSFRYVLPFHSIFASGSFTCLFRCSWPASLVTSFLACNNLDYHLQSERPLAATRSHAWPPAASCGHFWPQQIGQRFGSQLGTIAPRTPKKKSARFATWLGWSLFFPFWRFIVFEQAETEEHRFSCHGVSNKFPQTKAFNLWVWRRMFLTMSATIFLFTLIPARCLQGIKTDQNRKIKKRKRIQNESGKRKNQSENVERINMQWEL